MDYLNGIRGGAALTPGRYAAVDIGSHSVLLLVADVQESGALTARLDAERVVRLGEGAFASGKISREALSRASCAVTELLGLGRKLNPESVGIVGTAVFRRTRNGGEAAGELAARFRTPVQILSGEEECRLSYLGNTLDPRLPGVEGYRIVLDVGGGSTEITLGVGNAILERKSIPLGAVQLTEQFLKSNPPSPQECCALANAAEAQFSRLMPAPPRSLLLLTGGTAATLGSVATEGGYTAGAGHGVELRHETLAELISLFQSLPLAFRRRIPGVPRDRAEYILAGTVIIHQAMANLGISRARVSHNGVRHGCVYTLAAGRVLSGAC